jgi:cephalosporin hydroxylase
VNADPAVDLTEHGPGWGPPSPVPIWQWETEFNELLDLYLEVKPKRVLEIGTYHGGTLYHWLQNATPGSTVISLDSYATGVDNRAMYQDWVPEDVNLVVLEADSNNPATAALLDPYLPLDWVFIDGGHYYHEAKADWNNYAPLVREGGHVILHDIVNNPAWAWSEVEVFWRELQRGGRLTREIVHEKPDPIFGIGVVYL